MLVGDVVAHWLKLWCGSLVGYGVRIGWRCGGSLVEDVVAHWLDMRFALV